MMMLKDQTHIKRNCFSIGIISSNLQSGCYTGKVRDMEAMSSVHIPYDWLAASFPLVPLKRSVSGERAAMDIGNQSAG
jgi:hypothetical protein